MAAGYRDINTAKTVVGILQKWPAKEGGHSPKGPVVAGTTVYGRNHLSYLVSCTFEHREYDPDRERKRLKYFMDHNPRSYKLR